jgi:hypothetical protein
MEREGEVLINPHQDVINFVVHTGRSSPSPKGKGKSPLGIHRRINASAALRQMRKARTWKAQKGKRGQPQRAYDAMVSFVGGFREPVA